MAAATSTMATPLAASWWQRAQSALSSNNSLVADVTLLIVSQIVLFYSVRYLVKHLNPANEKRKDLLALSRRNLDKLGKKDLKLNQYEEVIASELVLPEDIETSFASIGGLEDIVHDLNESIIMPLRHPKLFTSGSRTIHVPKGVLFYGPPGCGKTMLARAIAKESGAAFINLHVSTMTDKWFGESNKLCRGLFSLAQKLQPAIVFIDEIDSFMRERQTTDHEALAMVKAEFMTMWDGLSTGENQRVVILGATNRPNDIDPAILRRMPKRFPVRPPNPEQRRKILDIMLKGVDLAPGFSVDQIVTASDGLTGSDLNDLCHNAMMRPLRELLRDAKTSAGVDMDMIANAKARPVDVMDFLQSAPLVDLPTTESQEPVD